jgi:hypothetical protein
MDGDDAPHAGDDSGKHMVIFAGKRGRTPGKALKALKRLVHGVGTPWPGKLLELVLPCHAGHDAQVSAHLVNRMKLQRHRVSQRLQGTERRHALARPEQLGRQAKQKFINQPGATKDHLLPAST